MNLELYYHDMCPFCHLVMRTIEELGIKERVLFKDILQHHEFAEELMRINGHRQVPCLLIDGQPMIESADINQFLKANFSHF